MDRFRDILKTIRDHLGPMNASRKIAIASLGVILVMTLLLVGLLTSSAAMVPLLPGVPEEDQSRAAAYLSQSGQRHKMVGTVVHVPAERRDAILAELQQSGNMPSDTTMLFGNLIDKQSWTMGRSQQEQFFTIALQNELSRVIRNFSGVKEASVIIDAPSPNGLGATSRKGTASATVFMRPGVAMTQETVDAVASLVAGARSGLDPERVRVIDGTSGAVRTPTGKDRAIATTYIEHAARVEKRVHDKLGELLSFIPGVLIAVTAEVDVSQRQSTSVRVLPVDEGSGVAKIRTQKSSTQEGASGPGAQPGVRSNGSADIDASEGTSPRGGEKSEETTESDVRWGTLNETVVDPRGMPTRVVASIAVPYGYIAGLVAKAKGEGGAEPTEQEVTDRFDKERLAIESVVRPHVLPREGEGEPTDVSVVVTLAPVDIPTVAGARPRAGGVGMTGSMMALGGGVVEKGVLAGLALAAVGMMVLMIRKASRREVLAKPEEIVGLPPALEANADIVGEADESDTPMAGIEVGEQEIKVQKMVEQLGRMAGDNPDSTAKLLGRWITTEE